MVSSQLDPLLTLATGSSRENYKPLVTPRLEQAHSDQCHDVVETENGVPESADEALRDPRFLMGEGRHNGHITSRMKRSHGILMVMLAIAFELSGEITPPPNPYILRGVCG